MPTNTNDILRTATRLAVAGVGDFVNVYHHRYIGVGTLSDAATVALLTAGMDALYDTIDGIISNTCLFQDINVYNATQFRPLGVEPWPTLVAGVAGGDPLPWQMAAFVRGTTGFSRNWAKKFIGPFAESANGPTGFATSGILTDLAAFGVEWLASTVLGFTAALEPVVYHRKFDTWRVLTGIVLSNNWATIRRRRPFRGS